MILQKASSRDLVSVVMPAFNAESTIKKAIQSVLVQTYPYIELLVVDDGSTDGTTAVVRELMQLDCRIMLLKNEANLGVGLARNAAIKASRGSLIAFFDADDVSLKDRIFKQRQALTEKGVAFCLSRIYRTRCTIEQLDPFNQQEMLETVKKTWERLPDGEVEHRATPNLGFCSAMFKRELFEIYGLYRDLRFAEDMEFFERVLFNQLNISFSDNNCPYRYLKENKLIPNLYHFFDEVLVVSPEFTPNNLSSKFNDAEQVIRIKRQYRSGIGCTNAEKLPSQDPKQG